MKDKFRSDLRAGKVTAPVLVVHGEEDTVVPITLGERLYAMIQAPKQFVRVAGGGHRRPCRGRGETVRRRVSGAGFERVRAVTCFLAGRKTLPERRTFKGNSTGLAKSQYQSAPGGRDRVSNCVSADQCQAVPTPQREIVQDRCH
ncbi:MAG: hypothetical protein ACLQU2_10350 [Candidatus Binataceae bacterium]